MFKYFSIQHVFAYVPVSTDRTVVYSPHCSNSYAKAWLSQTIFETEICSVSIFSSDSVLLSLVCFSVFGTKYRHPIFHSGHKIVSFELTDSFRALAMKLTKTNLKTIFGMSKSQSQARSVRVNSEILHVGKYVHYAASSAQHFPTPSFTCTNMQCM